MHQGAILRETIFNVLNVINPNPRIHVSPMAQVYGPLDQIIPVTDDSETTKVRGWFDTGIQITNIGIFWSPNQAWISRAAWTSSWQKDFSDCMVIKVDKNVL